MDYRPFSEKEVLASIRKPIIMSAEYGKIDTNQSTRPAMDFSTTTKNHFQAVHNTPSQIAAPTVPKSSGPSQLYGADSRAKIGAYVQEKKPTFGPGLSHLNKRKLPPIPVMPDTRQKSFKPNRDYHVPTQGFSGKSLYNDQFVAHDNKKCQRKAMMPVRRTAENDLIRQDQQNAPAAAVDKIRNRYVKQRETITQSACEGTYDTEYNRKFSNGTGNESNDPSTQVIKRRSLIRPTVNTRPQGKFYATTSYEDNFNSLARKNENFTNKTRRIKPQDTSNLWFKLDKSEEANSFGRGRFRNDYPCPGVPKPAEICRPRVRDELKKSC